MITIAKSGGSRVKAAPGAAGGSGVQAILTKVRIDV